LVLKKKILSVIPVQPKIAKVEKGPSVIEKLRGFAQRFSPGKLFGTIHRNGEVVPNGKHPSNDDEKPADVRAAAASLPKLRLDSIAPVVLSSQVVEKGIRMTHWARLIVSQPSFKLSGQKGRGTYRILTPRQLGFTEPPYASDLMDNTRLSEWSAEHLTKGHVIDRCPADTGLRILTLQQYPDQPVGQTLWIVMEPMQDPRDGLVVFAIECAKKEEQWLLTGPATVAHRWPLDRPCLFRERRIPRPVRPPQPEAVPQYESPIGPEPAHQS
jgi:hypothetical protein